MSKDIIVAPWTDEQIKNLNEYQNNDHFHPYTCPSHHEERGYGLGTGDSHRILIATKDGWKCPTCDYEQNWAHTFSAEEYTPYF